MLTLFENRFWLEIKIHPDDNRKVSYKLGSNGKDLLLDEKLLVPSDSFSRFLKNKLTGISGVILFSDNESITLATDVYGMLPIYRYTSGTNCYMFSHFTDLIEAVPQIVLTPDKIGVLEAMLFDSSFEGRTIFAEIDMIPQSMSVSINLHTSNVSLNSYSNLSFSKHDGINVYEAGIGVADRLRNALAHYKDEHFLLPLSGGVDSRLLAGALVDVFGPDRITAVSFACRKSSYELKYAKKVCDVLGIKDWRSHILTKQSYMRSLDKFPNRFGGNLSISHGHLYDAITAKKDSFSSMTLISGAFADAAGGFHATSPEEDARHLEESHYYHHLELADKILMLGDEKHSIKMDLQRAYNTWEKKSSIKSFDEYYYITNRQPRVMFTQSVLYRDILPVQQPFADAILSNYLFGLPYNCRQYKQGIRSAIGHISPQLAALPDISSKMRCRTTSDYIHIYKGKVLNNLSRIATLATLDRHLFFSPYQTECQDYNLRTSHRKQILTAFSALEQRALITKEQRKILEQKPRKQYGGGLLPCVQYWALTIKHALDLFSNPS